MNNPFEKGPDACCPLCGWDESIPGKDAESVKIATANPQSRGKLRACLGCNGAFVVSRVHGVYQAAFKRGELSAPSNVNGAIPSPKTERPTLRKMPPGMDGMRKRTEA